MDDEAQVELLLCQGYSPSVIQRETGLSRSAVYRHKQNIEAKWEEAKSTYRNKVIGRIFSNQIHVQRAAWEGWKRSLEDEAIETEELIAGSSKGDEPETKKKTVRRARSGDSQFLAIILRSDALLAKVLGVEQESQRANAGISPEFAVELRRQLGISPEHFRALRQKRLQREAASLKNSDRSDEDGTIY